MIRLTAKEAKENGLLNPSKKKKPGKLQISRATWNAKASSSTEPGESIKVVWLDVLFIIPENFPSMNVWKRWHWSKQAEYLKQLTKDIKLLRAMAKNPEFAKARVEVTHYFRTNRRRDKDNQVPKFLLDALRYAGVIAEDNAEVLELPEPEFFVDPDAWRTEIRITKI